MIMDNFGVTMTVHTVGVHFKFDRARSRLARRGSRPLAFALFVLLASLSSGRGPAGGPQARGLIALIIITSRPALQRGLQSCPPGSRGGGESAGLPVALLLVPYMR